MMAAERDLRSLLADDSTLSALDRHYARTLRRIRRKLAVGVTRLGSAQTARLEREINQLINTLDPRKSGFLRNWIRRTVPKAFVLGDRGAAGDLQGQIRNAATSTKQAAGITSVNRTTNVVNKTALRNAVKEIEATFSRTAQELRSTFTTTIRNTQSKLFSNKRIADAVKKGRITGAEGRQIAKDLAGQFLGKKLSPAARARLKDLGFGTGDLRNLKQIGKEQVIRVGNRRFKVRAYNKLVARTKLAQAQTTGTIVRLQKNDIDHVKVTDHRQTNPDECSAFAGKVYYIGGLSKDPAGFPNLTSILNGGPPFHPNCRHGVVPYVIEFKSAKKIAEDKESAKQIPRRFFGKGGAEIREEIAAMSEAELRERFPEQLEVFYARTHSRGAA